MVFQGLVFVCSNCGSEVTLVRAGAGRLTPRCCNRPMLLREGLARVFYCANCGSEVTVIREGGGTLALRCCNRPMLPKLAQAA